MIIIPFIFWKTEIVYQRLLNFAQIWFHISDLAIIKKKWELRVEYQTTYSIAFSLLGIIQEAQGRDEDKKYCKYALLNGNIDCYI